MDNTEKQTSSKTIAKLQRHQRVYATLMKYSGLTAVASLILSLYLFSVVASGGGGDSLLGFVVFVFCVSTVTTLVSLGGLVFTLTREWSHKRREKSERSLIP